MENSHLRAPGVVIITGMPFDDYFSELESELEESVRAQDQAVQREEEQLRVARLSLVDRLQALAVGRAVVSIALGDGLRIRGAILTAGDDWCALHDDSERTVFAPLASLRTITTTAVIAGRSMQTLPVPSSSARISWGFILRDLAARQQAVHMSLTDGSLMSGVLASASADHCDFRPTDGALAEGAMSIVVAFSAIAAVLAPAGFRPPFMAR